MVDYDFPAAETELLVPTKGILRNAELTRKDLAAAKRKLASQQDELAQMEADRETASQAWAGLNQASPAETVMSERILQTLHHILIQRVAQRSLHSTPFCL